eukprot:gene7068-166_t
MERFSSSEDLSGEENRHWDLVPETQIPDSQRGLDLAFTPPLPPRSRQVVGAPPRSAPSLESLLLSNGLPRSHTPLRPQQSLHRPIAQHFSSLCASLALGQQGLKLVGSPSSLSMGHTCTPKSGLSQHAECTRFSHTQDKGATPSSKPPARTAVPQVTALHANRKRKHVGASTDVDKSQKASTPKLPPFQADEVIALASAFIQWTKDVRAKADRGAIHKFDQSNVKRGEAMVTAMKEASQTVVRPYQAYNEKIDSMCSLFKLIEDLYRQHKLSRYASFWHLLDLKATKDEQAMNKVSSLHKDLPKTRQHWYTEDVHKMLQDTEGCRPVNDHGGVYDMSRMASQGLERSNTSDVRTSAASGTAGDDDDDLDLETSSPPPKRKKARSSEPPQNHEGPSTGIQRETSSVGMDRLVSILEDMGHRDDTDMVDSIGGMSGSVKSMAEAQHELNPYMFKALEGIAGLAQQE